MNDDSVVKASIIILSLLSLYILWPYASALLFALILAYFSYPAYKRLEKRMGDMSAAASLSAAVAALLAVLITEGLRVLVRELRTIYQTLPELMARFQPPGEIEFMGVEIFGSLSDMAMTKAMDYLTGVVASIPQMFFSLLVFFIGYFYFLREGDKLYYYVKEHLPFEEENRERIIKKVKLNVNAFIRAEIVVAISQGIVGGLIFYILGHTYPLFFGIIIGILALIPVIGPSLVYWPVGLYEVFRQNYLLGAAYIISGICIISTMDYFIRPKVMGDKARIHPFIVLVGFLGGIFAFGPAGIVIGPVLLSLSLILIDEFKTKHLDEN